MNIILTILITAAFVGGIVSFIDFVTELASRTLLHIRRRSFLSLVATELEARGVTVEHKDIVKGVMQLRVSHHSIEKPRPIEIPATFELEQVNHARFADYLIAQTGINLEAPAPVVEAEA